MASNVLSTSQAENAKKLNKEKENVIKKLLELIKNMFKGKGIPDELKDRMKEAEDSLLYLNQVNIEQQKTIEQLKKIESSLENVNPYDEESIKKNLDAITRCTLTEHFFDDIDEALKDYGRETTIFFNHKNGNVYLLKDENSKTQKLEFQEKDGQIVANITDGEPTEEEKENLIERHPNLAMLKEENVPHQIAEIAVAQYEKYARISTRKHKEAVMKRAEYLNSTSEENGYDIKSDMKTNTATIKSRSTGITYTLKADENQCVHIYKLNTRKKEIQVGVIGKYLDFDNTKRFGIEIESTTPDLINMLKTEYAKNFVDANIGCSYTDDILNNNGHNLFRDLSPESQNVAVSYANKLKTSIKMIDKNAFVNIQLNDKITRHSSFLNVQYGNLMLFLSFDEKGRPEKLYYEDVNDKTGGNLEKVIAIDGTLTQSGIAADTLKILQPIKKAITECNNLRLSEKSKQTKVSETAIQHTTKNDYQEQKTNNNKKDKERTE